LRKIVRNTERLANFVKRMQKW